MDAVAISTPATINGVKPAEPRGRDRKLWKVALLISGGSGVLCVTVGLLFSFESLVGLRASGLSSAGTILVAASFLLGFIAAHSMDKIRAVEDHVSEAM